MLRSGGGAGCARAAEDLRLSVPAFLLLWAIGQGSLLQDAVAIGLGLPGSERLHFQACCLEIGLEDRFSLKPGAIGLRIKSYPQLTAVWPEG